jgi:cobalt/nickel transport protein
MNNQVVIQEKKRSMAVTNLCLLILVVLITVIPLISIKNAKFEGSDDQAETAIMEINGSYKPWFAPIFVPPSGEIESLLFCLQAAIGAGLIGYAFGYWRGRQKKAKRIFNDIH